MWPPHGGPESGHTRRTHPHCLLTAPHLCDNTQEALVWAVDLSPVAVAHTLYNAGLAGVSEHVHVLQGSWCAPSCPGWEHTCRL